MSVLSRILGWSQLEAQHPPTDCAAVKQLDNEAIAEARRKWREPIHTYRNRLMASFAIARKLERASENAVGAAQDMIADIQKMRERVH